MSCFIHEILFLSVAYKLFPIVQTVVDDGVTLAEKTTYAHNKVRYLHAVQDLVWDQGLADDSKPWANLLASENSLHHSEGSKMGLYGENLYKGFDGFKKEKTVADAVYNWYIEIKGYDFDNPAPDLEVHGHFTAVVWRTTTRVGCAITSRELYDGLFTFIVCRYVPTGNVDGFFLSNIMRLRFGATIPKHPRELKAPIGCIDRYENCNLWSGVCGQTSFRTMMLHYCKKSCKMC